MEEKTKGFPEIKMAAKETGSEVEVGHSEGEGPESC